MTAAPCLRDRLAAFVVERQRADFDEIAAAFPKIDRERLRAAIYRACSAGLIVLESRGVANVHMVLAAAVYWAPRPEESRAAKQKLWPVASVWELGTPRQITQPSIPGRRYQPLGDWKVA